MMWGKGDPDPDRKAQSLCVERAETSSDRSFDLGKHVHIVLSNFTHSLKLSLHFMNLDYISVKQS